MTQKEKREDQRVRITKQMLRDGFLGLLAQKPIQNITVKELCEAAGINRGTFYLHYHDVYDLMEKLENELLTDFQQLLRQNPVIGYTTPPERAAVFTESIFAFFQKNKEMCAILLGDNGDKKFVAKIIEIAREKSVREYRELYPYITREEAEIYYTFIAHGFLGLLQVALQNPQQIGMEHVAEGAERIIQQSVRYFERDL